MGVDEGRMAGNRSEEWSPWIKTSFMATDRRDMWICCVPGALLITPWKQSNLEIRWWSVIDEPPTWRSVYSSLCWASLLAGVLLLQRRLTQGLQRSILFSSSFLSHSSVFVPPNKGGHVPKSLTPWLCPGSAHVHRFGCKAHILLLWHICEIPGYMSGIRDDTPIPQHYPNPKLPPKRGRTGCFIFSVKTRALRLWTLCSWCISKTCPQTYWKNRTEHFRIASHNLTWQQTEKYNDTEPFQKCW